MSNFDHTQSLNYRAHRDEPGCDALRVNGESAPQAAARAQAVELARLILDKSEANVRGYVAHELANLVLDLLSDHLDEFDAPGEGL